MIKKVTEEDLLRGFDEYRSKNNGDEWLQEDDLPKKVLIKDCVKNTLNELKEYKLSRRAKELIEEFIIFRMRTQQEMESTLHFPETYYNLLIKAEETDRAVEVCKIISNNICNKRSAKKIISVLTEQELLEKNSRSTVFDILNNMCQMVVITECKRAPVLDVDLPMASMRADNMKEVENYHDTWKKIAEFAKKNPEVALIVVANSEVYNLVFSRNTELYYRIFGHHVYLNNSDPETYLRDVITQLKDASFKVDRTFEVELTKYFNVVYPKAELRRNEFVVDLFRRITSLYYCKERENRTLTVDCIPKYNANVRSADDILSEFDDLIGMDRVKNEFRKIYYNHVARSEKKEDVRYHMLFTGNPGTGKTTVAQMTADLFEAMGIINTNKLITKKPSDFLSEWRGGTGKKVMSIIESAYDGILFIDEAYGLATGNEERGAEVVNILLQEMENNRDRLIVIFAGYKDDMKELFKLNKGLESRIGKTIEFEDYTLEQLCEILEKKANALGFIIDPTAKQIMEECVAASMTKEFFSNAREMEQVLEKLKETWSEEYYELVKDGNANLPKILYARHFEKIMPPKKEISIENLVGLDTIKKNLKDFNSQVMYQKALKIRGMKNLPSFPLHMIFTGNPGTGKTTVAEAIAQDLYSVGVTKTDRLVKAERKDLVGRYAGETTKKAEEKIKEAIGGVLFVDEAYALSLSMEGHEVIEVFLTAMEEHREDTVFIFAGYTKEMYDFLQMNPGIKSRIGFTFHFEDYTPDELTEIFNLKMKHSGFKVNAKASEKVKELMEYFYAVRNFGNGRFVDHVIHQTISNRAKRDYSRNFRDISVKDIPTVQMLIETAPDGMYLYDPTKLTLDDKKRTAYHELGHALLFCVLDREYVPGGISIKSEAGSYGRMILSEDQAGHETEEDLRIRLASLLAGRNAERVMLGNSASGCSSDYRRAKNLAGIMINEFAMGELGVTKRLDLLKEADRVSTEILTEYKDFVEKASKKLLKDGEISGKAFRKMLDRHIASMGNKSARVEN